MLLDVASRVAISGSAFAGFTLVFLGNAIAGYNSYETEHQGAVRAQFLRRAGLSLAGFIFGVLASATAISYLFFSYDWIVYTSVALLGLSFVVVLIAAIWSYITVW
ncbi:hypothetical protein [Thalassobaculum litoreum]|uniref:hypothetical protein n=1 Tax=Thalassobaculum litoreum TaxID=420996 RepID=UPI0011138F8B|nr:hypothetical protein [Thalassobaculum litoreum]